MKDLEFLKQSLIAHRGYFDKTIGIPENSLPSFSRAIENGFIIELDVHILKDKNIVVFHDDDLNRMTGVNKKIKELTYEEISKLRLDETDNKIPLLTEVLNLVSGKVPIIIELKYDAKYGKLESELVKILSNYKGKFVVKSFNPLSVFWFKKHYPEIIRGQLAEGYKNSNKSFIEKYFLKNMWFNFITKPDFASYEIEGLPNSALDKFKRKHLVLGWTVRTKEQFEKGKKYFDNLICENFNKLKYL